MKKVILLSLLVLCTLVAAHGATSSKKPQKVQKAKIEKVTVADTATNAEPQFMNGDFAKFKQWCLTNVAYPPQAADQGITGKVYVSFIVDIDGKVSDARVIVPADPILNKALLDIVNRSPKWKPARKDGAPVRTSYTIDMSFSLTY